MQRGFAASRAKPSVANLDHDNDFVSFYGPNGSSKTARKQQNNSSRNSVLTAAKQRVSPAIQQNLPADMGQQSDSLPLALFASLDNRNPDLIKNIK
jgi:hypothetical protein